MNFAPVCDVSTNPDNFIYARSFGQDAQTTADYISSVVPVYAQSGVACVLKHFPGYGNNADTHTGIALDARPYTTFEKSDLVPFESGIAAGAPFVLVSHNIVECMDGAYPASLSAKVHTLLRDTLGFTGVIVTDDLAMDAVKSLRAGRQRRRAGHSGGQRHDRDHRLSDTDPAGDRRRPVRRDRRKRY